MREYNQVETDEQGRVTFMEEKPEDARTTLGDHATTTTRAMRSRSSGSTSSGTIGTSPRLPEWLAARTAVYTWQLPQSYDIGSTETLQEAEHDLARVVAASRRHWSTCSTCSCRSAAPCAGAWGRHFADKFVRRSSPVRAALRALRPPGRLAGPAVRRVCRAGGSRSPGHERPSCTTTGRAASCGHGRTRGRRRLADEAAALS